MSCKLPPAPGPALPPAGDLSEPGYGHISQVKIYKLFQFQQNGGNSEFMPDLAHQIKNFQSLPPNVIDWN